MRLQIKLLVLSAILGVVGLVILGTWGDPEVQIGVDEQAKLQFASLPAVIHIKLRTAVQIWQFKIERGVLAPIDAMPQPPREASNIIFDTSSVARTWPRPGGFDYEGNYLTSPDGNYISASIVHKQPYEASPTSFVIVDLSGLALIAEVAGEPHRLIDKFAWSPDSQMVAVLAYSEEHRFRLKNVPASMSGHPISYVSYYLVVYDKSGRQIVSSRIATNLVGSSSQIVWSEPK